MRPIFARFSKMIQWIWFCLLTFLVHIHTLLSQQFYLDLDQFCHESSRVSKHHTTSPIENKFINACSTQMGQNKMSKTSKRTKDNTKKQRFFRLYLTKQCLFFTVRYRSREFPSFHKGIYWLKLSTLDRLVFHGATAFEGSKSI